MDIIFQLVKLDFPILKGGFHRDNQLVKTGDNPERRERRMVIEERVAAFSRHEQ
jgi:hypothetical protein